MNLSRAYPNVGQLGFAGSSNAKGKSTIHQPDMMNISEKFWKRTGQVMLIS